MENHIYNLHCTDKVGRYWVLIIDEYSSLFIIIRKNWAVLNVSVCIDRFNLNVTSIVFIYFCLFFSIFFSESRCLLRSENYV